MGRITGISGTGTQADPYLAQTWHALYTISIYADNLPANYIRLTADIDYDAVETAEDYSLYFDYYQQRRTFYLDMDNHTISNITLGSNGGSPLITANYCMLYIQNGVFANVRCVNTGVFASRTCRSADNGLQFKNVSIQMRTTDCQNSVFSGCMFNRCAVNICASALHVPLIMCSPTRPKETVTKAFYQCDIRIECNDTNGQPVIDCDSTYISTHELRMINCRFTGYIGSSVAQPGATQAIITHGISNNRCIYDINIKFTRAENLYYSAFNTYNIDNLANSDLTKSCTGNSLTLVNTATITDYSALRAVWAFVW